MIKNFRHVCVVAKKQVPHGNIKICFGYDPDNNLIEFVEDLKR